jgi:hypothetical protein
VGSNPTVLTDRYGRTSRLATAPRSNRDEASPPLRVQLPLLPLEVSVAERRGTGLPNLPGGFDPRRTLSACPGGETEITPPCEGGDPGSTPGWGTGGLILLTPGPDGQAVGCNPTEVGSIPAGVSERFRCSSDGKSVALKARRPLARTQPPELASAPDVRGIQTR